jgi:hypothetical protein
MGIDGVKAPEKPVAEETVSSAASKASETVTEGVKAAAAKIVGEAVEAAKVIIADTDVDQEHNEL